MLLSVEVCSQRFRNEILFFSIRDAIRRDAVVYCTKILPLSNMMFIYISQYFDNYLSLSFEEWQGCLQDVIKEVEAGGL